MFQLLLGWTLLTGTLWSLGSSQTLLQEQVKVLYPKMFDSETIECECFNVSCDFVFWFRTPHDTVQFEYIGKSNNADRDVYSSDLFKTRFKIRKRSGVSYTLRINRVTQDDTGVYSCVLTDNKKTAEVWRPGVLLLPGVTPPTPAPKPKPKPPRGSGCRCNKKNQKLDECGSMVLWPLVGLIAGLSVAILCTLYYFSRLPKKCRHRFVKK